MSTVVNKEDKLFVIFEDEASLVKNFTHFQDFRRIGKLFDVVLKANDVSISAHRIILAAHIPYFNAMFSNDVVESRSTEISIEGVEASALECLINFVYTGKLRIDSQNVESLMCGASYLQLTNVLHACAEYIITELAPHNVLGVRDLADVISCSPVSDAAKKFIDEHFCEVSESEEFLLLSLDKLLDLIERNELHVPNEDFIFGACIKWVQYNKEDRAPLIHKVLPKIRLSLLSLQCLSDCLNREDLLRKSLECRALLDNAKDTYSRPEYRQRVLTALPLRCYGELFAIGIMDTNMLEVYNLFKNNWHLWDQFPHERKNCDVHRITFVNGIFYIFYVGLIRKEVFLDVYDVKTRTLSQLPSSTTQRNYFSVGALDDRIYVCGGANGFINILNNVECYSSETGQWITLAPMPDCACDSGIAAMNGKLYACGGWSYEAGEVNKGTFRYDPTTDEWIKLKSMPIHHSFMGVASMNGRLHALVGSRQNTILQSYLEIYDPITNCWEVTTSTNCYRDNVLVVPFHRELWVIDKIKNHAIEIYDPTTKNWRTGSSTPINGMTKMLALGVMQ